MSRTRTTLAVSIGLMLAACGTIGTANAAPDASNNTTSTSATLGNNYAERADVQKFVEQLNAKKSRHFTRAVFGLVLFSGFQGRPIIAKASPTFWAFG